MGVRDTTSKSSGLHPLLELVSAINDARSPEELAAEAGSRLREALAVDVVLLAGARAGGPAELLGALGVAPGRRAALERHPLTVAALGGSATVVEHGADLFGVGMRHAALSPFRTAGGDRAALAVARRADRPLDRDEIALLEAVAGTAGHALERLWLAGDMERAAALEGALARVARAVNADEALEGVLRGVCREVAVALDADIVTVYQPDRDEGLVAVANHGVAAGFSGFRRAPGEGLAGRAVATGAPQVSNAYAEEGLRPASTAALGRLRSGLSVPLRSGGRPAGALSIGFERPRWVGPADVEAAASFAELVAAACRSAGAARPAATVAPLDHAAFEQRVREELARAERAGEHCTLIVLDVGADGGGPGAGEALRDSLRLGDHTARLGPARYALLLPATDESAAAPAVARAVAALAPHPVRAGVAEWVPGERPADLLARAEQALAVRGADPSPPGRTARPAPPAAAEDHGQRRMRRLATAAAIGARLSRLLDPRSIASTAIEELSGVLGHERCAVLELAGGCVTVVAADGFSAGASRDQDEGVVGEALRRRTAVRRGRCVAVPVHAGTALWGAIELWAADGARLDEADAQLVQTVADYVGAALRTAGLYRELEDSYVGTAEALAAALEAKDNYTADHARSIADLAVEVGRRMGMGARALRDLRYGAVFHDIGKIAVPDAILNKEGALTAEEFEIVKRHPVTGEQILAPVPFLAPVRRIVRHDHERWDGLGYPDGLRGDRIPLGARIVSVVDALHAMVSDRPYRRGLPLADARLQLRANAGTQFDPAVVEALVSCLDDGWTFS